MEYGKVRSRRSRRKDGSELVQWRIDFSPQLQGSDRFLNGAHGQRFDDERDAERTRLRICTMVEDLELSLLDAVGRYRVGASKPNLIATHIARWRAWAEGELQPWTLYDYDKSLRNHFGFWDGKVISDVTTPHVRDWIAERRSAGCSPKVIKNAMVPLRAAFRHYREGSPKVPDIIWPAVKVPKTRRQAMAFSDVLSVVAAIPEEDQGIFLCSLYTMCRPGEARGITVGSYDFKTGVLTIQEALKSKSGVAPKRGSTKTEESGDYPLPAELRDWIAKHRGTDRLQKRAPLFINPRSGTAYSEKALRNRWITACTDAGVEYVSIYRALKHSPGTALLESGLSRDDLQAAFRHKSASTTMIYDLEKTQRRARATQKLEALAGARHKPDTELAEAKS